MAKKEEGKKEVVKEDQKDILDVIIEKTLNNEKNITSKEALKLLKTHIEFQIDWNLHKCHIVKINKTFDILRE